MGRVMAFGSLVVPVLATVTVCGVPYSLYGIFLWKGYMFVPGYVGVCELLCKMGRDREKFIRGGREGGRANGPSHCIVTHMDACT